LMFLCLLLEPPVAKVIDINVEVIVGQKCLYAVANFSGQLRVKSLEGVLVRIF
jgi:hypothetical protein